MGFSVFAWTVVCAGQINHIAFLATAIPPLWSFASFVLAGRGVSPLPASLRPVSEQAGWPAEGRQSAFLGGYRPDTLTKEAKKMTTILAIVGVAVVVYILWHLAFFLKNFGSSEDRRLWEVTH